MFPFYALMLQFDDFLITIYSRYAKLLINSLTVIPRNFLACKTGFAEEALIINLVDIPPLPFLSIKRTEC